MIPPLLLQTATENVANPWWVSVITGSGGALVVLMMWVRNLSATVKKKDGELLEISRESIECITRILERQDQDKDWKDKLELLLNNINSYLESSNKKTTKEP